ncbi:large proline-rich protein BAG6-like [Acropora millepora]|uniref:large proline-rich protein BAG6-like n=1 Tax=Acropora millepora TaxID=45264 RepID=UPI001CF2C4D7|nr:large proline-rich protein BAG6-like [Acropora millepora]
MKISVKTLDSQTKNFTVSETFKVKEFKEYIASEVNIPADKQRLIFRGKVLQDDKLLSEYGANGCVIHLVERKPQTGGGSSQDGPGSSSSSSTGHSHDGSLGPNIVMGAFSMPVDVVGATQQIVQSLVNQLGVDSAQANISTSSSDDGSSVNVHINLQATTQPGNDVSQRINRARHFLRAASSALNRTEVYLQCYLNIIISVTKLGAKV